ncbi:MAG: hypothetical protein Q7T87_11900 [Polaromonas sp.]|nr:hypothetical protein [Polaromonas sp.]
MADGGEGKWGKSLAERLGQDWMSGDSGKPEACDYFIKPNCIAGPSRSPHARGGEQCCGEQLAGGHVMAGQTAYLQAVPLG